ncbi:MAG: VapC toxin family PIN domain ribonuclease [Elusimicrobia bacterium CG06_land_8_20_14_3_00_38_11]|nr:MAG: VapC toxin family PIN domain ribonuclease [Elusimicrobia bacterium CG06_land_8_20_14_3_00_38_11]
MITSGIFISVIFLYITIGVILFKSNKENLFQKFVRDIFFNTEIITLGNGLYTNLADIKTTLGLDFDDAYQYEVSKEHNLKIVTIDLHFEKVRKEIKIIFLQETT